MSLREHWTVEPRIGDLYSTPIRCLREESQNDIEQIGSPYRQNLHHLLSDCSDPGRSTKQMSRWMSYKRFLRKCEKKFAKVDLYVPDFLALKVVGTKVSAKRATLSERETMPDGSECDMCHTDDSKTTKIGDDQPSTGPRAELNTTSLFLHGKPGDHTSSSVILSNKGSTSLCFEWRQQPHPCLCTSRHEEDRTSETQFFHIVPLAGILMPGETKAFYVEFHPKFSGMFIDSWILVFSPVLSSPTQMLRLFGAAGVEEEAKSKRQRKLLQESLEVRQRTRCLDEVFYDIIENVTKQVEIKFNKAPDFVCSKQFFDFMRSNIEYLDDRPLYYNPKVHLQLQDLATEICNTEEVIPAVDRYESMADPLLSWDLPVSSLVSRLDMFAGDEKQKEKMLQKASSLQLSAAIPAHPIAILHTVMYKVLCNIATQMGEVMERNKQEDIKELSEFDPMATSLNDVSVTAALVSNSNAGKIESAKSFGSSFRKQGPDNPNVAQEGSGKHFGRRSFQSANAGQGSLVMSMERSSLSNATVGWNGGLQGFTGGISAGQANGYAKDSSRKKESRMVEQALASEGQECVSGDSCEALVRELLHEGIVDHFCKEVETAVTKLAPIVKRKIDCFSAEGDRDSASWLFLWFTRLLQAFGR